MGRALKRCLWESFFLSITLFVIAAVHARGIEEFVKSKMALWGGILIVAILAVNIAQWITTKIDTPAQYRSAVIHSPGIEGLAEYFFRHVEWIQTPSLEQDGEIVPDFAGLLRTVDRWITEHPTYEIIAVVPINASIFSDETGTGSSIPSGIMICFRYCRPSHNDRT